jgi:hypothetical protein
VAIVKFPAALPLPGPSPAAVGLASLNESIKRTAPVSNNRRRTRSARWAADAARMASSSVTLPGEFQKLLVGSWHAICRLLVPMASLSSPTRPRASSVIVGRRKPHTRRRKRRDSEFGRSTVGLPLCPASSPVKSTGAKAESLRACERDGCARGSLVIMQGRILSSEPTRQRIYQTS